MAGSGPVFVIGAPRSGTSLVHYLLAAHPELAYADIGLQRLWSHRSVRAAERANVPLTRSRRLHAACLPEPGTTVYEPTLRILGLDPLLPAEGLFLWFDRDLPVDDPTALRPEHLDGALVDRIRGRYAALSERMACERFVDKSPGFTHMLGAIQVVFPDAHVVHVIRDGRAVVNSMLYGLRARGKEWAGTGSAAPVVRASRRWRHAVAAGREGAKLFPGRYHEVRYERIVEAPRGEAIRLLRQLGLRGAPAERYPLRLEDRNYKWHEPGRSFGDAIWTDRTAIEPHEYGQLEALRPLLELLGYVAEGEPLAA
jgi:hypothetical protein